MSSGPLPRSWSAAVPGSPLAPGLRWSDGGASGKSSSISSSRIYRRCVAAAAIVAYLCSGLTIVVINKSIVHDHGLRTPSLVSATGALCTAALTRLLVSCGKVQVRPAGKKPWEFAFCRALPVGLCAAGSLCFGNASYIYLDAGFVQMLKAGTPALLLLVLACLRVELVSFRSAALAMCMVCGSALASAQQPNANATGLVVQLLSQVCEVVQCALVQVFLQHLGFEAWDAGYYLAPAIASCCLLPALVLEWPHVIAQQKIALLLEQVPLLLLSGAVGIVVNLSSLYVIKFTSSILAKLLVIARSSALVLFFIFMGEEFTYLQVIGYVFTIVAFFAYSIVKAREMDEKDQELEGRHSPAGATPLEDGDHRDSDEDLLDSHAHVSAKDSNTPTWDPTAFLFWFAICSVAALCYQAMVVLELESGYTTLNRQLLPIAHPPASSQGLPPTPYLEPITAGTHSNLGIDFKGSIPGLHTVGSLSVQSPAKVLYLSDGRFLLHQENAGVILRGRAPGSLLSSSWLITSRQFGMVEMQALNNRGEIRWLSCDLKLVKASADSCQMWMTASRWDRWSSEAAAGDYVLRKHGKESVFLEAGSSKLSWGPVGSSFRVSDWVPEECPLRGMSASSQRYVDAEKQVTFTMTTYFRVFARSIMFRQAMSSVFMHLKERDTYIKEFLVINDWYDGNSLAFNGTFTGPTVEETRLEMLTFFPGCSGTSPEEAKKRGEASSEDNQCLFIFKGPRQRGQANSLNMLLDLMVTKFWIHFEDDQVLYQDVYVSRLLAPMYEQPQNCREASGRSGDAAGGKLPEPCQVVASVRLGHASTLAYADDVADKFEVRNYSAPLILFNQSYVEELLAHGGFNDDPRHSWGDFEDVKAVAWPLLTLQPSLHNVSYIKSLEAPLFYEGRAGRFSEDPRINSWQSAGKSYNYHWDFELEFAVRWARKGATLATLNPGACMRDISNGISSFERSFDTR